MGEREGWHPVIFRHEGRTRMVRDLWKPDNNRAGVVGGGKNLDFHGPRKTMKRNACPTTTQSQDLDEPSPRTVEKSVGTIEEVD